MSTLTEEFALLDCRAGYLRLDRTLIEVRGADRASFLHNLCTNDVKRLAHGTGCEAFFTNVQGKLLGHVLILCDADSLWIDTVAGQAETLLTHLDKYLIREDVRFVDQSRDWCHLLVAGSEAAELLERLGMDVQATLLAHSEGEIAGKAARVFRSPFFRECISLHVASNDLQTATSELQSEGLGAISVAGFDAKRIEFGFPLYGRDISTDNLPQEIGRDAEAISFTKGCYLGQETVARIDALGHVNKRLLRLKFEGSRPPQVGQELVWEEKPAGRLTSVCTSPTAGMIGLGYVRASATASGTRLAFDGGSAIVV